jgi:uncharacterized protein YwqG/predicted DNA-binding WGR domain protein
MRRFEFKDGSSNKFWEVTLSDKTLTVRFGRFGSKGQEKSTTFPWPELAQKEQDKLIAEKLRKGYKEVGAADAGQSGSSASTSAGKPKSPSDILSALKQCEPLKRVAAQLNSLQRLSLRITTAPAKETAVGISKLGGRPDLPAGISWPTGKVAGREMALPFIAQFDVAMLWRSYVGIGAIGLLPTSGMLYFFYNTADYGADYLAPENWRVIYHSSRSNLAPSEPPLPLPPLLDYRAREVRFQTEVTLPNIETCYIGGPGNNHAKVELTEEEWDAYADLCDKLRANQNIHQMFGHADDAQPYALENSYESVRDVFFADGRPFKSLTPKEQNEEFHQGRLLLQVDEEKSIKMQFGRGGRLYFFIREQDLKARDFSKVWVNEQ